MPPSAPRGNEIARTEHMVLTIGGPPTVRVWCTQFASCRWAGYRRYRSNGDVSSKPCPRCGGQVTEG